MSKAKASARRPEGALTEEQHRSRMQALEKERFDLTKEIAETAAKTDYSTGELAQMKKELAETQAIDVTQNFPLDNST